jgi:large subunit ribosomal protein L25
MALIREIQHEPITGDILHIDFLHISPTQKIHITVPVTVVGIADGVKNFGGILQLISRELEIESLPSKIPDVITVDVSSLGIGDAIHVRDLAELAEEDVTYVTPADRTVVSVVPPTVIKEVVAAEDEEAAEEGEAAGEPEVIGEKAEGGEEAKGDDKGKDKGKEADK